VDILHENDGESNLKVQLQSENRVGFQFTPIGVTSGYGWDVWQRSWYREKLYVWMGNFSTDGSGTVRIDFSAAYVGNHAGCSVIVKENTGLPDDFEPPILDVGARVLALPSISVNFEGNWDGVTTSITVEADDPSTISVAGSTPSGVTFAATTPSIVAPDQDDPKKEEEDDGGLSTTIIVVIVVVVVVVVVVVIIVIVLVVRSKGKKVDDKDGSSSSSSDKEKKKKDGKAPEKPPESQPQGPPGGYQPQQGQYGGPPQQGPPSGYGQPSQQPYAPWGP
jgi:hypothetical protein